MAKARIETGRVEEYRGDQLVVALPHLEVVRRELSRLGARPAAEADEGLGLALLTLQSTAAVVDRLRADVKVRETLVSFASEFQQKRGRDPSDLDLLLRGRRELFAIRFAQWVPTMGKNRVVGKVKGFPHLGGGGVGYPTKSTGHQFRLSLDASDAGRGARVAMLDTAVVTHPELVGHFVAPRDALIPLEQLGAAQPLMVTQGHGTFVAGMILRWAPSAELDVRKVLEGDATGDAWGAAKEMVRLAGSGVDILNLSCGCFTDDDEPPLVLARAVDRLSPDVVIVAAAGNHGDIDKDPRPELPGLEPVTPMWPAALEGVVAVGAGDGRGKLASFSPRAPWVELVAPGVHVESTYLEGEVSTQLVKKGATQVKKRLGRFDGFARWSGTSFAAAAVSGAIAAHTRPGHVSAREALQEILDPSRGQSIGGGTVRRFTVKDLEQ